jgi:spore coat protein CotH
VSKQLLHGLERFTINNNKQDPSNVRQCLAYQAFNDAGLAAPRCNFAHVMVNGRDLGIYTHIEEIKKPFIRRHFSDDEGNLYEGVISDFTETGKLSFQQKTNNEIPANRADIDAVQAALADESPGLAARLDRIIDTDSFIRLWVMETVTSHWDGYASNSNNFYLYNDPDSGRFHFIPWGTDGAFATMSPVSNESSLVFSNGLMARRAYDDPELRERYFTLFEEVLTKWDTPGMLEELDRMEALLQPFAGGGLSREMDRVRDFVQTYPAQLLSQYQQQGAPDLRREYDGCE